MNTLPKELRAELLDYYGYGIYARRAAPTIWPPAGSAETIITWPAAHEYFYRAATQGCRTSLELTCRITPGQTCWSAYVNPFDHVAHVVAETDDVQMAKYLLQSAKKRTTWAGHGSYSRYALGMGCTAARLGHSRIMRLCRDSLPATGDHDREMIIQAACEGQTACVLVGLKEWGTRWVQEAMEVAASRGHLETFLLCREWGGKVTENLIRELEKIYAPVRQRLKAVIDKCRELHERGAYVGENY